MRIPLHERGMLLAVTGSAFIVGHLESRISSKSKRHSQQQTRFELNRDLIGECMPHVYVQLSLVCFLSLPTQEVQNHCKCNISTFLRGSVSFFLEGG